MILPKSITTDSVIPHSEKLTVTGDAVVTASLNCSLAFTAAEGVSVLSNDTENMSCIYIHGPNSAHPDCSIVCDNGTSGSDISGSLGIYALSNANNVKHLFFNVCTGYGGTTFYGDGAHDDQPAIMAAIAACKAAGALVSEVGRGHVFIPAGFHDMFIPVHP